MNESTPVSVVSSLISSTAGKRKRNKADAGESMKSTKHSVNKFTQPPKMSLGTDGLVHDKDNTGLKSILRRTPRLSNVEHPSLIPMAGPSSVNPSATPRHAIEKKKTNRRTSGE